MLGAFRGFARSADCAARLVDHGNERPKIDSVAAFQPGTDIMRVTLRLVGLLSVGIVSMIHQTRCAIRGSRKSTKRVQQIQSIHATR